MQNPTRTEPLSKRSRRILEEANNHLNYALRGLESLSIEEYERLVATCATETLQVDLGDRLNDLRQLRRAIAWHVGKRG